MGIAPAALVACVAGDIGVHGHMVAHFDPGDGAAYLRDHAAEFVPQNHRRIAFRRALRAAVNVYVRAAYAAGLDLDQHRLRPHRRHGIVLVYPNVAFSVEYRCFHEMISSFSAGRGHAPSRFLRYSSILGRPCSRMRRAISLLMPST